jgi:hypothetical protein
MRRGNFGPTLFFLVAKTQLRTVVLTQANAASLALILLDNHDFLPPPSWLRFTRERGFSSKEVNLQKFATFLLFSQAGYFFSSPVISSLRAVNFGPGCSNRRIKGFGTHTPIRHALLLAAMLALSMLGALPAQAQLTIPNPIETVVNVPTPFPSQTINGTLFVGGFVAPSAGTLNIVTGGTVTGGGRCWVRCLYRGHGDGDRAQRHLEQQ